jgi:hypothetical protein
MNRLDGWLDELDARSETVGEVVLDCEDTEKTLYDWLGEYDAPMTGVDGSCEEKELPIEGVGTKIDANVVRRIAADRAEARGEDTDNSSWPAGWWWWKDCNG